MCSQLSKSPEAISSSDQINRLSDISTIYGPASLRGGWQGGDYQALLEGEGMVSCDSSIYAWSENGHRDHINAKKKKQSGQKRKRSSAVVHGTLIMQKTEEEKKDVLAVPSSLLQLPTTGNSEAFSASFSSPLQRFPITPARSSAGRLVLQSPTTPRSLSRPPPLPTHHAHQDEVDDSPIDVATIVASGWAIEPEEGSDDYSPEAASVLIDSLLFGVQEGFLTSAVVDSPSRLTEIDDDEDDNGSQTGWETEDCEITPRLRKVWQEEEPSSASFSSASKESSRMAAKQSKFNESTSEALSIQTTKGQRQSFIRVPSAIFPHTPAQVKADRRMSSLSITSVSSATIRRSRQLRYSSSSAASLVSNGERSGKRRSIHLASTPARPMSRKSKYYSRTAQAGAMPLLKQQHLKGARGKFWSPMNSLYIAKDEPLPTLDDMKPRQSTRFSRRSGQAWVRPRTFEVKDQYRVTIYPPQVDESHCRRALQGDPDKTPTQAQFKAVASPSQSRPVSRASRASSISWRLPPGPQPNRQLPPVPAFTSSPRQSRRLSKRVSKGSRLSQGTTITTITYRSCSTCQSDGSFCSCSQSYTDGSRLSRASDRSGTYSESQTTGYSGSLSCTCADASTCSCTTTRSSMVESQVESMQTPRQLHFGYRDRDGSDKACRVLGIPRSAPLHAPPGQPIAPAYEDQAHSAPYFSTEFPPVLDPLPRFSPLHISFDDIFGKRRSKRWTRYSMSDASSRASMSTRCSTCVDGSEISYLRSKRGSVGSITDETFSVSDSMTYTSESLSRSSSSPSSSASSSSPMSELASDHGSEEDSDMPSTPTRSEYQSSFGLSESPGYRMSFIVSPMPQSAKRHSQREGILSYSPQSDGYDDNYTEESRLSALRPISQFTSTTATGTTNSSRLTTSTESYRAPRSILKTSSNYRECSQGAEYSHRRPTVSMAVDTVFKNNSSTFSGKTMSTSSFASSSFSSSASNAPQRATLATSTATKHDLEGRIQREENRRKRNESRLFALEKLEGKTKKSSLFFSLLSNASSSANPASTGAGVWHEEEEEMASPLPRTPLTPAKNDLLELQRQVENRQRITQFQNNKAVSFTDVIGFDMGTYPKVPRRDTATASSDEQDALLKTQLKKLSTAIEARQYAKDKFIDK